MAQFIGMDIHRQQTVACIYDPVRRTEQYAVLATKEEELVAFLKRQPGPCRVAFEVNGLAGRLYDRLRPLVDDLQVANPSQTPWIYRTPVKTDRLDAKKLAVLMSVGQLPTVHMPSKEVRQWRQQIQHRRRLVERGTQIKNRIRTYLVNEGIERPVPGGWWTQRNKQWIRWVAQSPDDRLSGLLPDLVDELELLDRQIKRITQALDERGARHPGVALLQTIPGVGPRTAEALIAYIDDISRFARSSQLGCYFGLTPRLDESAQRRRTGHISKSGPSVVRWVLGQAAWQIVRRSPAWKQFYERVQHGQPGRKKIAIVAVARKLTKLAGAMLRDGTEYDERRVLGKSVTV